jgi:inner membrane transporter RhtA
VASPVFVDVAGNGRLPRPSLLTLTTRSVRANPPTVQVLLGIVSVQIGAATAKQLFATAGAGGTVALRLFFAAVVLLLIWRPTFRLDRRALPVVLAYGVVLGVMNLCFYQSIARIPLGIAVTIEFLGPLAVALSGSRRLLDGLWALLAGAGVVLLTETRGELSLAGLLFALGAGICWGGYILLTAALGNRTTDGQGLAIAMTVAALVVMPVGIVESGTTLLDPWILTVALAVALLSSVVPYSLELEALRTIPPRVFGVLMSMEPAVAALAGLLVLGEALHAPQWIAVCLVVIASVGATRFAARPKDVLDGR